jgi:hypothetical protein
MTYRNAQRALHILLLGLQATVLTPAIAAGQAVPVIDSVTLREDARRYEVIYPEFHFHDASGTVHFIHRELVATNSPRPVKMHDGLIEISAEQQIRGATYVGGWECGPETYYVTVRAFLMNLEGGKSNVVEYTIHCNGG